MRKDRIIIHLILFLLIFWYVVKVGSDEDKYKKFLEDVSFIIDEAEKKDFRKLTPDGKEAFIEAFWKRLDPVPFTLVNEFKEEYYERLNYVDKWYGRNSDRARVYMLLGKPDYVNSYASYPGMCPLEIWHYDRVRIKALPSSLRLIFFKKGGIGDYKLYSPLFDGAISLITNKSIDLSSMEGEQYLMSELPSDIREGIKSISPGIQENISEGYLAILRLPLNTIMKKVKGASDKAKVESVVYLDNCVADLESFYHIDSMMNPILDSALLMPPAWFSYQEYIDKIYSSINISVTIRDEKGQNIELFTDEVRLEFPKNQWEQIKNLPIMYTFSNILLEGRYRMCIIAQDTISNKICRIDKDIDVNVPKFDDIEASDLLIVYRVSEARENNNLLEPFALNNLKIYPVVQRSLGSGDKLFYYIELYLKDKELINNMIMVKHTFQNPYYKKEYKQFFDLSKLVGAGRIKPITGAIDLYGLKGGNYNYEFKIIDGERILLNRNREISIANIKDNHKRIIAESSKKINDFELHYILANQYYLKGDYIKAKEHIKIALDFDQGILKANILMIEILLKEKDLKSAEELLLKYLDKASSLNYLYYLAGEIYYFGGRLDLALGYFKRAEENGFSTNYLLNKYVGDIYYKKGDISKAIEYFNKSLRLNSEQLDLREALEKLESK